MRRQPFSGEAKWIWADSEQTKSNVGPENPFRTALFRRSFDAPADASLTVFVSADTEYVLFCNGHRVRHGPAKGDIEHQFYDPIALDDYLKPGENTLAAVVTSYAPSWVSPPTSRMSLTHGFVVDGVLTASGNELESLATDNRWFATVATGYGYEPRLGRDHLAGANEIVDARRLPTNWFGCETDPDRWYPAIELEAAVRRGMDHSWCRLPYRLMERQIPPLADRPTRFSHVFAVDGVPAETIHSLISGDGCVEIPPNSRVQFILDAGVVTTGYPRLVLAEGRNSAVTLHYSEALFVDGEKTPHHRPAVGTVEGHWDRYHPDGHDATHSPISWRAFRYVDVEIETGDDPMILRDIDYRYTGYPYEERASFASSRNFTRLWDVSWRTVERCSHETFEDCPYYEQLQYAGDTQPVMRFAGYVSGDWRLGRQAVYHFDWSRDYTGLTKSRYPSRVPQQIPSWSLLWVRMVRDYWWFTADRDTARDVLPGVDATLGWFERRSNANGLAEDLPHWKVVDWSPDWNDPRGVPPGAIGGVSTVINLQYAAVLRDAAQLHEAVGDASMATKYQIQADQICSVINETSWDDANRRYLDEPGGDSASELGNAWAILSGAATDERAEGAIATFNADDVARAAWYGRYYLFRAARTAGCYDQVAGAMLDEYNERIANTDLTTFPERYGDDSSYCHAWSSAPLFEFLGEILGIKPASPGFKRVEIAPRFLDLDWAEGSVPTPGGPVTVSWHRDEQTTIAVDTPREVAGSVVLPDGTRASFSADERHTEITGDTV